MMEKTIFVVDDNDTNLMAAKKALSGTYKTYAVPSAEKMFKLAEKITPDLILLDIEMPEMDGFEAMEKLKKDSNLCNVPVIFLTARHDVETEIKGLEVGALDFINKPFATPVLLKRIKMHIENDILIKDSQRSLRDMQNATISVIAEMVENRDAVTGEHIERTQKYLEILIKEMLKQGVYVDEIAKWDLSILLPSAQLHDLGKISISDIILNKPGKLTKEEFEMIQKHTLEGERLIEEIIAKTKDDGFLSHAKKFAGYHHEKWNGEGYPRKLAGEAIPLQGRIMAVVDVYDALTNERPYKKAFSHEESVDIIKADRGKHFDPKIVDIFLSVADEFKAELER
ncbi:putative two-component system response regulator [Clostridiales Family XIII bacterium PM5-7]